MHWNLLIVLESDLDVVSRYIEFHPKNFATYSTELSKLLLSSCSEIDVVMKEICATVAPAARRNNVDAWADVVNQSNDLSSLLSEEVTIDRFNLSFKPFENWSNGQSPFWWKAYNKVKHERVNNFDEASLNNVLFALSGLTRSIFYLERLRSPQLTEKQLTSGLQPATKLLKMNPRYYYDQVVV